MITIDKQILPVTNKLMASFKRLQNNNNKGTRRPNGSGTSNQEYRNGAPPGGRGERGGLGPPSRI